jgi:hypothetical protein
MSSRITSLLAKAALAEGLQIADTDGHKVDRLKEDRFGLLGKTIETIGNLERHEIIGQMVVEADEVAEGAKTGIEIRVFGVEHLSDMKTLARKLAKQAKQRVVAALYDVNARAERFLFEDEEETTATETKPLKSMASRHERRMANNARLANWDKIQESAKQMRQAEAARQEQLAAERKAKEESARREYEAKHPVSSGKIPLVDYVPPKWAFKTA